jgi:hypothetical protein
MTADPTLQSFRALHIHIGRALDEAHQAYAFAPNSYSYRALSACLAAEQALDVLRAALDSDFGEAEA